MKFNNKIVLSTLAAALLTFTGCGSSSDDSSNTPTTPEPSVVPDNSTLSGDITSNMTLTADRVWILDGLVAVKDGAILTIEAGTTIGC